MIQQEGQFYDRQIRFRINWNCAPFVSRLEMDRMTPKRNEGTNMSRHKWLTLATVVSILVPTTYIEFNPSAVDGRNFFHHLSKMKIDSIEVMSLDSGLAYGDTVEIDDPKDLQLFLRAWRGMDTFLPNHPRIVSSDRVTFHTSKGIYAGVLSGTSNQGVIFLFNDSPKGWPVSSYYQLIGTPEHMSEVMRSLTNTRVRMRPSPPPPHQSP
jgi:hypothetical protein